MDWKLSQAIISIGFELVEGDQLVYFGKKLFVTFPLYVNDILLAGNVAMLMKQKVGYPPYLK